MFNRSGCVYQIVELISRSLSSCLKSYSYALFQVQIVCPAPECGFRFKTPRQWALHACEIRHPVELKLPTEALEALFSEHDARIERMKQEDAVMLDRMIIEWAEEGIEQRKEVEEAFLHELEHDPEYAHQELARQTKIWRDYSTEMNEEEIDPYIEYGSI